MYIYKEVLILLTSQNASTMKRETFSEKTSLMIKVSGPRVQTFCIEKDAI